VLLQVRPAGEETDLREGHAPHDDVAAGGSPPEAEGEVSLAPAQVDVAVPHVDGDRHPGMLLAERRDDRREHLDDHVVDGGEANAAAGLLVARRHLAEGGRGLLLHRERVGVEVLPRLGERVAARAADEEARPHRRFELGHPAVDGGRVDAQHLCGRRQCPAARRGEEDLQVAPLEGSCVHAR
jgi:hypothetical protein